MNLTRPPGYSHNGTVITAAEGARITMVTVSTRLLWTTLAVMGLCACAGNGEGLDAAGRPLSEGGGGNATLSATFDSIQANVFSPICAACHAGASAPQGLRLDEANSYSLLVGVPSTEVPSILRVRPGDPNNSYIIQKLEGHAAVGGQMPLGGPPLSATTIAFIRQWITDGALRSPAARVVVDALQLNVVTPEDGDAVPMMGSAAVVLEFSQALDASRVGQDTVRIERLADDETGAPTAVPATVSVPAANSAAIVLVPQQPLAMGRYRITVTMQPGNEIADLSGRRLSGLHRTLGGDATVATFTVEEPQ